MTAPFDEREDRAVAKLNAGRCIRVWEEPDVDLPFVITDAETGVRVIALPTRERVGAFIARYGCTDTDAAWR